MADEDAVLVGSGSFRVDRARALEKLQEHQLEDAECFLLPWARCAVLLGATALHADKDGRSVGLRFDGRPLAQEHLKDPFQALFDEPTPENEPCRHLAVGLLGAQRLSSSEARVESGPGRHTELRAQTGGFLAPGRVLDKLRSACAMLEVPLFIDGVSGVPLWEAARGSGQSFTKGTARGFLSPVPHRQSGRVHLYRQGVRVCEVRADLSVPAVGHVNDDSFRLNASHSGVLRDMIFDYALRLLEENSSALLKRMLANDSGEAAAWLRQAASGLLSDPDKDSVDPLRKDLWGSPIFLTVAGTWVSLASLRSQYERLGYVPVSPARFPDSRVLRFCTKDDVVWMADPSDSCLETLFEDRLRVYDWRDSLRDLGRSFGLIR